MELIEIKPDKRFGKPTIKGTRITVYEVLNWLASGLSKTEILNDHMELSEEQLNACLSFAANRELKMSFIS
jgi:uncharacterized protein (DUF433 family)